MHRTAIFPILSVLLVACSSSESSSPPVSDSGAADVAADTGETGGDAAEDSGPRKMSCGDIPVLGAQGPANTPACVACMDDKCCAEGNACGANAECTALRACFADCKDAACEDACWAAHPDGQTASQAVGKCRSTNCAAECANFACVGSVTWPEPKTPTYTLELAITELQSGAAIGNATVKVCKLDDAACSAPLSETTADAGGVATITAPSVKGGIAAYLEISGADVMTTLLHVRFHDGAASFEAGKLFPYVVGKSTFSALTGIAGVTPDASRGHVTFLAMDCAGFYATGVSATVASADASSTTAYIQPDGLPSTTATSTSTSGFGAVVNVPPGATTIRGTVAATKVDLGSAPIVVRAGAITSINVVPSP